MRDVPILYTKKRRVQNTQPPSPALQVRSGPGMSMRHPRLPSQACTVQVPPRTTYERDSALTASATQCVVCVQLYWVMLFLSSHN